MSKTKTRQILEYIRDNSPAKAGAICKAVLKRRYLSRANGYSGDYSYYPGWSGFRVHLTRWGDFADKTKTAIRLTKRGYVLTDYGRSLLGERNKTMSFRLTRVA